MRPTIGITTSIVSERGINARPDCVAVNPKSVCMNSGSRKVTDISIANITAPIIVPEKNTMSLNSEMSTAGTRALSSRTTSSISVIAEKKAMDLISADWNQSSRLPSSSTYCSDPSPAISRPMPHQSMFLRCRSAMAWSAARTSGGSCTKRVTISTEITQTGTLM